MKLNLKGEAVKDSTVRGGVRYKDYIHPNYPDQLWNTREDGSLDVSNILEGPSLTQQQFKDECDINTIMKSYVETGTINHLNRRPQIFADFSEVKDFQESLDLVLAAQQEFALLPAKVRARFENNPAKLVEFCNDPKNLEEAIELGLADPVQKSVPDANNDLTTNASSTVTTTGSKSDVAVSPQ